MRERASEVNRLAKILEGVNIKLSPVASDVTGVSRKAIWKAMAAGETDPQELADLAVGRLAEKQEDLMLALEGRVRNHHRFMLKAVPRNIDDLLIEELDAEVEKRLRPFEEKLGRLDAVPGIGQRTAEVLLAELGTEMSRFRNLGHLAGWAEMCPGNNHSGGNRPSGKTRKRSSWLRAVLVQAALSAIRVKASCFKAQYARLKGRRGPQKAIVAVAHSLLVTIYHLLSRPAPYMDLGKDHFDRLDCERIVRRATVTRRIKELGFDVSLKKKGPAA